MKAIKISFSVLATVSILFLAGFASQSLQAGTPSSTAIAILDSCPTANFSITNNNVSADTPVQFSNLSTGASSYLWVFGDGTTSTNANPSHVYGTPGTYTAKLYATFGGCTVEVLGTEDIIIW